MEVRDVSNDRLGSVLRSDDLGIAGASMRRITPGDKLRDEIDRGEACVHCHGDIGAMIPHDVGPRGQRFIHPTCVKPFAEIAKLDAKRQRMLDALNERELRILRLRFEGDEEQIAHIDAALARKHKEVS